MTTSHTLPIPPAPAPATPAAARTVLAWLPRIRHGRLSLEMPDGRVAHFGEAHARPQATLRLHNWKPCAAVLRRGDIGAAETFIAGDWSSSDLSGLLTLLVANREHFDALVYGSWWGSLLHRLRHALNRNSRRGSRDNIHAHYDLGNAFYALWLDPSMNYSSAWFEGRHDADLERAQSAKMRRALRQAGVRSGSRVLEIGCGWGALAELAAREFDARITGVTLSAEQLAYGQARLQAAGLGQRATLRFQDYRELAGGPPQERYDAIVSIEMFEAVGHAYWGEYFAAVKRNLGADGRACIQTITIRDDLFDRYLRSTDFIQQYIFPGGLLPSAARFRAAAAAAGLRVVDEFAFGLDYAETLRRWRASFLAAEASVRALGFDTRFMRTWEFYLAYCEAAFVNGNTSVVQFTLQHA